MRAHTRPPKITLKKNVPDVDCLSMLNRKHRLIVTLQHFRPAHCGVRTVENTSLAFCQCSLLTAQPLPARKSTPISVNYKRFVVCCIVFVLRLQELRALPASVVQGATLFKLASEKSWPSVTSLSLYPMANCRPCQPAQLAHMPHVRQICCLQGLARGLQVLISPFRAK